MTFRKQHAPAVCHTHYRNQPQPSQAAGSQDTSYLKTKKNAQPFHKHRRPWHKPKAQEQSQSTWKTAAAAALTAACLTEELRQHPRVRDSLQAPDKLCMAPQHGDRPFQCHPVTASMASAHQQLLSSWAALSQKPAKHVGWAPMKTPSNGIFQFSRISVSGTG